MTQRRWIRVGRKLAYALLALGVIAFTAWFNLFRTKAAQAGTQSPEQQFLYGSMGSEYEEGTPYWIWMILPKVFPEYLPGPGGYASIGLGWAEGHELPMGVSKRFIGVERIGVNCAFCHVTQVRFHAEQAKPNYYPGGPGHQVRVQEYQEFLFKSAADPRFNPTTLMREIEGVTNLSAREALLYRNVLIPLTKRALLKQRDEFAFTKLRPEQGPGRIDPFNPVRFRIFKQPDDHSIGNSDMPSIWNQKLRTGQSLHWDGLTKEFSETLISSAIGDGARGAGLDLGYLDTVKGYLAELQPPAYPLVIDRGLARRGEALFRSECGDCHSAGGALVGTVIPLAEIGTDPHRTRTWTQGQVDDWKKLANEYRQKYDAPWNLDTFNKREGYVSSPLDGVWLRAPYLHNGSVPSLRALLEAPDSRPKTFYRGHDVFDSTDVGFVSDVPAANGKKFFRYDVSVAGNSNSGHVYGTTLGPDDKHALVEYMKTL